VEVLFGDVFERREFIDASVVDQDVEPAEGLLRLGEETLALPPLLVISATTRSAPSLLEA